MATIYDIPVNELIEKTAEKLKEIKEIQPPEWAAYVKTGRHKERPPVNNGWWYIRTAAVLRSVYKLGPIGVSKLRIKYGGKKNRGHKPERFFKGSGNIIRKILQQLEKAGFLKQAEKARHKGRILTPAGKSFLDKISIQLYKEMKVKKKEEEKEVKAQPKEQKEAPKEIPKKEEKPKELPKKEEKPKIEAKEKPKEIAQKKQPEKIEQKEKPKIEHKAPIQTKSE